MKRQIIMTIAMLGLFSQAPNVAAEDRLQRIKDTRTMVIAHGETAIPFSYMLKSGPVGFGVDVSLRIADAVKTHLGLDALKIRWNPVTLSTRFPMVVTNTVDLECITTTNTRARQELVAFSNTYFVSNQGFATRRDSGIKSFDDLAGKRVAVVRGTTTETALRTSAVGITLVPERNNRMAMAALKDGAADAYIAAAPIIAGEFARLADPSALQIISTGGQKEAFGCMLPKGDAAFKTVVDDALVKMMASGEMEGLYKKWFLAPIPPYGRTLNVPLTEENQRLYQAPNDTAYE